MKPKQRIYKLDNIKTLLIFSVVLSHFIELFIEQRLTPVSLIYTIIHLFCMPLFMFVTGYFAKCTSRKAVFRQLLLPYLLFQTLYLLFDAFVIQDTHELALQYTTPYWLLWFLVSAAMYQLLMPFLDTDTRWLQAAEIVGAMVVSLLAGLDDHIGYYLSLSRFFTFAPYFLLGHYAKKNNEAIMGFFERKPKYKYISPAVLAGVAVMSTLFVVMFCAVDHAPYAYFGSYSYHAGGYDAAMKFALILVALGIGALYVAFIPNKRCPWSPRWEKTPSRSICSTALWCVWPISISCCTTRL